MHRALLRNINILQHTALVRTTKGDAHSETQSVYNLRTFSFRSKCYRWQRVSIAERAAAAAAAAEALAHHFLLGFRTVGTYSSLTIS